MVDCAVVIGDSCVHMRATETKVFGRSIDSMIEFTRLVFSLEQETLRAIIKVTNRRLHC